MTEACKQWQQYLTKYSVVLITVSYTHTCVHPYIVYINVWSGINLVHTYDVILIGCSMKPKNHFCDMVYKYLQLFVIVLHRIYILLCNSHAHPLVNSVYTRPDLPKVSYTLTVSRHNFYLHLIAMYINGPTAHVFNIAAG